MRQVCKIFRQFSSIQRGSQGGSIQPREGLQFSKKRLTEFGELPQGVIPEALETDLPFNLTTLENGIKVATEQAPSQLASVQVLVKAGTRQEDLESSGTVQFLNKLNLRGTQKRSREQIEKEIDNLGGNIQVTPSRETTTYTLSFEPSKLNEAVDLLGDILLNSVYNKNQIEAERDGILRNSLSIQDQQRTTLEAVHYTSYRDHFISQPVNGIRENLSNITEQHLKDYHAANFVGPNFVVAGAGNISHEAFVSAVKKSFGSANPNAPAQRKNSEKPYHTPSNMFMRDDELSNLNIGVFFEAPSYTDPDFFAMQVFKNIMGEYRADKYTGKHLNASDRQYSLLHKELGNWPDVTLHKCDYFPYSDTGLFGSYLFGNEVFAPQMLYVSQVILSEYASYLNPVELFRAKNTIYNQLAEQSNTSNLVQSIAEQVAYLGRRIPRSEYAKRISHFDTGLLNRAATRWFWDRELSVVAWGPCHGIINFSHYNRPIKRSTLGWYGNSHMLIY